MAMSLENEVELAFVRAHRKSAVWCEKSGEEALVFVTNPDKTVAHFVFHWTEVAGDFKRSLDRLDIDSPRVLGETASYQVALEWAVGKILKRK